MVCLPRVTIFACALFTSSTPKAIIVAVLFAGGLFRSMQFTGLNIARFRRHPPVPTERREHPIEHDSTDDDSAWALPSERSPYAWPARFIRQTSSSLTAGDFRIAFGLVGLVALVAVVDSFSLASNAGAEVSGHRAVDPGRKNHASEEATSSLRASITLLSGGMYFSGMSRGNRDNVPMQSVLLTRGADGSHLPSIFPVVTGAQPVVSKRGGIC